VQLDPKVQVVPFTVVVAFPGATVLEVVPVGTSALTLEAENWKVTFTLLVCAAGTVPFKFGLLTAEPFTFRVLPAAPNGPTVLPLIRA